MLRRVVDLEAVREPRRLRRLERPVQGRQPVGVGLSITGTVFLSGKWTSAMSASSLAKSRPLRRSVTFTWRHASSGGGWTMNIEVAAAMMPSERGRAASGNIGSGSAQPDAGQGTAARMFPGCTAGGGKSRTHEAIMQRPDRHGRPCIGTSLAVFIVKSSPVPDSDCATAAT